MNRMKNVPNVSQWFSIIFQLLKYKLEIDQLFIISGYIIVDYPPLDTICTVNMSDQMGLCQTNF